MFYFIFSSECCLGHNEFNFPIIESPTKVNKLTNQKVVDVGCGNKFTVILTTETSEKLPYIYPKEKFNEKYLRNIKERTKNIMDVLSLKKNMRNEDINSDELFEIMQNESKNFEEKLFLEKKNNMKPKQNLQNSKEKRRNNNSWHVFSKKNLLETSKNLLNDITISQITSERSTEFPIINSKTNKFIIKNSLIIYFCEFFSFFVVNIFFVLRIFVR